MKPMMRQGWIAFGIFQIIFSANLYAAPIAPHAFLEDIQQNKMSFQESGTVFFFPERLNKKQHSLPISSTAAPLNEEQKLPLTPLGGLDRQLKNFRLMSQSA